MEAPAEEVEEVAVVVVRRTSSMIDADRIKTTRELTKTFSKEESKSNLPTARDPLARQMEFRVPTAKPTTRGITEGRTTRTWAAPPSSSGTAMTIAKSKPPKKFSTLNVVKVGTNATKQVLSTTSRIS